jgi:tRNA U34 5-carboxymethylaminomethyl modifying enzyme MnmG/GidA
MTTEEPIDLSIIDDEAVKKLQEKHKKIKRVMDIIRENELEKDQEFMDQMHELMDALIEEKD